MQKSSSCQDEHPMYKMPLEKSSNGQKGHAEHFMPVLVKLDIPILPIIGDALGELHKSAKTIEEIPATEDH